MLILGKEISNPVHEIYNSVKNLGWEIVVEFNNDLNMDNSAWVDYSPVEYRN